MSHHVSVKRGKDGGHHKQLPSTKKRKKVDRFHDSTDIEFTQHQRQKSSHIKSKRNSITSHITTDNSDESSNSDAGDSGTFRADTYSKNYSSTLGEQFLESKSDDSLSDDSMSEDDEDNETDDQKQNVGGYEEGISTVEKQDEYAQVKKELSNLPLEDLMKIKERIGLKVFNKIMHGSKGGKSKTAPLEKMATSFKRENKNRPREMSAKRPVPIARHTDNLSQKHKHRRDPRFDDLSGEYKDEYFEKNYSFLDDIKEKEKQMVKKELKKTTEIDKKKELQGLLMRMTQQKQVKENKKKSNAVKTAWKSKEKERIKEGKQPYFLKKSERKKLELAEKFKELQKSGKLEQYMSKKRKKNAQKERKKLPQQMNKT